MGLLRGPSPLVVERFRFHSVSIKSDHMNFYNFERNSRLAGLRLVAVVAAAFIVLGRQQVAAQEKSMPPQAGGGAQETEADVMWQTQMHNAAQAIHDKSYALAEQSCEDALKTAGQFNPADVRLTTNWVFLAGIYQMENKTNLAEQAFKAAIASREKAGAQEGPDLVMPLEKLANFYYFVEHRYDLAAPLCLRILHIVEKISPADDAEDHPSGPGCGRCLPHSRRVRQGRTILPADARCRREKRKEFARVSVDHGRFLSRVGKI